MWLLNRPWLLLWWYGSSLPNNKKYGSEIYYYGFRELLQSKALHQNSSLAALLHVEHSKHSYYKCSSYTKMYMVEPKLDEAWKNEKQGYLNQKCPSCYPLTYKQCYLHLVRGCPKPD